MNQSQQIIGVLGEGKTFTFWFRFDGGEIPKVKKVVERGSGFELIRVFTGAKFDWVLEIESAVPWNDLDLDANSMSSPFKRLTRKPSGNGIPIKRFEDNIIGKSLGRPK